MKNKYEVLLISCWALLIICFIMKLFGANWFELTTENQHFIDFCARIEYTALDYVLGCILYVIGTSLYVLALFGKKFFSKWDLFGLLLIILVGVAKIFITNAFITFGLDLVITIVIPIIQRPSKWYNFLISCVILFIFQIISNITKNIGLKVVETLFIATLYSIDYYIMLVLFYLYSLREGGLDYGKIWSILFRKRRKGNN